MAMFDRRTDSEPDPASDFSLPAEPQTRASGAASRSGALIGKTITIKGDVTGDERLVIDGKVEGTVNVERNDCVVGQSGHVDADVKANVVRIEGEVHGDISGVEKVVITKTGRVHGNLVAPRVTLEDGSKFKGSIDMDPGPAQASASRQGPQSVPAGKPQTVAGPHGAADRA